MEEGSPNDKIIQEKYQNLLAELNTNTNKIELIKLDFTDFINEWNKYALSNSFYNSTIYKDLTNKITNYFVKNQSKFDINDWTIIDFMQDKNLSTLIQQSSSNLDSEVKHKIVDKLIYDKSYEELVEIAHYVGDDFDRIKEEILKQNKIKIMYDFMEQNSDNLDRANAKKFVSRANDCCRNLKGFKSGNRKEAMLYREKICSLSKKIADKQEEQVQYTRLI